MYVSLHNIIFYSQPSNQPTHYLQSRRTNRVSACDGCNVHHMRCEMGNGVHSLSCCTPTLSDGVRERERVKFIIFRRVFRSLSNVGVKCSERCQQYTLECMACGLDEIYPKWVYNLNVRNEETSQCDKAQLQNALKQKIGEKFNIFW